MLRNQGIRTKLLAVLALPIVALIVVTTIVSLQTFDQARQARQVEKLAQGADTLGSLVTSLQAERSITAAFLGKRPVRDEMLNSRKATDKALAATRAFLGGVDISALSGEAKAGLKVATDNNAQLVNVRKQVDTGYAQPDRIADRYTSIIDADIALPARIGAGLSDRAIGSQLGVYSNAELLAELATQERELGLSIIAAGEVDAVSATNLARLAVQESQTSIQFRQDATLKQISAFDNAIYLPVQSRAQFSTIQAELLALTTGKKVSVDSSTWRVVSNDRLSALQKLPAPIAASTASVAAAKSSSASNRALLMLIGSGLLVLILIGLGLTLARAITRPLRHLTKVAGDIADELPRMVERMATPGEGPGMSLPEIPVNSHDEVGQLAAAFKDVNATTIRVAEEQAALRASIAEMFVNVARRNHVLLSRQLSFIDQLERTEENPDTLDNLFRLDHLATRMRRNAESLIVLAGIDAGRRLRRPMPLSDVIRTAVSEIERYDRVDLALQIDPPMVGHVALTTAHLLAELLENATQFSNPDTRVISSTALTSRGVRITITDLGLGMTWDEINEANQRIAAPPSAEVVGSQRLGFYVVGRLARRLDSVVELKPGRAQGTVVTIDLPPALFVSGSVPLPEPALPVAADSVDDAEPADLTTPDVTTPDVTSSDVASSDAATAVDAAAPSGLPDATDIPAPNGLPSRSAAQRPPAPAAPGQTGEGNLPRRSASTPVPPAPAPSVPAAPAAPAADATGAPRSGIFSNFRSRRAVESEVGAVPPVPAATSLEELATQLPEFVPTLDTATPALPQRGEQQTVPALPQRGSVNDADTDQSSEQAPVEPVSGDFEGLPPDQVLAETDAGPVHVDLTAGSDEVESVEATAELAQVEPPEVEPVLDWSSPLSFDDAELTPATAPSLLDTPSLADTPRLADDPAPVALVPDLVPDAPVADEPSPVFAVTEPAEEPVSVDLPAEPAVAEVTVPDGVQARSTLSELAREAPAPVDEVVPEPAIPVIPVGTPALDILPGKHGSRGLRLRRTSRPRPVSPRAAVQPDPAPTRPSAVPATTHPVEQVPVPAASDTTPTPFGAVAPGPFGAVAPSPFGAPAGTFGQPAAPPAGQQPAPAPDQPAGPIGAPPSLFAPAPAPSAAPVDGQPSAPTPAFPPTALPALAAAQSLRERSAMAAEALSELSALSSYRPESLAAETRGPTLTRRTPQASPAAQIAQPQEPQGVRRANRSAADVRTMLSGFRAGVERGRTSPTMTQPGADGSAPVAEGVEP